MGFFIKMLLWGLALTYAGICALGWWAQGRMIFRPTTDTHGTPSDLGLPHSEVWLKSRDASGRSTRILAWWLPISGARATVLFCHGNAGNITDCLDTLLILHRLRVNVLIFDYQGYGRSEGEPSEAAMANDARAAWNWLLTQKDVHPRRIVLMGRSLGGPVAARLAAEVSRPAEDDSGETVSGKETASPGPIGLILESTFTSLPDLTQNMYPWLPVRLLLRSRFDTLAALTSGAVHAPLLVIHSAEDELVPYRMGRRLLEAYRGGHASFLQITGRHNSGFLESGAVYPCGLDDYFMRLP